METNYAIVERFSCLGAENPFLSVDLKGGEKMDSKELKRILAGLSIATLLASSSLLISGCEKTAESA